MIRGATIRALLLSAVFSGGLPGGLGAQDPCPGAAGPDAEAGWAAYRAGDMAAARARFADALERCPAHHYARTGMGYVDLREGRTGRALELFGIVLDAEPDNVDALVGAGLARWRTGELERVREHFSRVLELRPDHPTAVEYLDRVAEARAAEVPASDPADRAWSAGETDRALELYTRRLEEDPADGVALLRVGLVRAWRGDYDDALELLNRLVEDQPGNLEARLARARVLAWSGDLGAARAGATEVLEVEPGHPEALEALTLFENWAAVAAEPDASAGSLQTINVGVGIERARALGRSGDPGASIEAYRTLLDRDSDDVEARLGLARTLAWSGNLEGAVTEYDRILAGAPEEVRAMVGKARTLGWAGRLVEAENVALRAVETHPRSPDARAMLGEIYRWQQRNAAAERALETAAGLAPTRAAIQDQLRAVRLAFAPRASVDVRVEDDSDGNRMLTTSVSGSWHPVRRLELRVDGFVRDAEQELITVGLLDRQARGLSVSGGYTLEPGWTLSAGLGGSSTDGVDDPAFFEYEAGVSTPPRHRLEGSLRLGSEGLTSTAALAQREVRGTRLDLTGRWEPAPGWRLDGTLGVGVYEGAEENGRRSAFLGVSRRLGSLSLGASFRGFSFEKDLNDGYFDPEFYGIWELPAYWLHRPGPWTLLVEVAPGIQLVEQAARDGEPGGAFRSNVRVAYEVGPGREVSASFAFSSAGLARLTPGRDDYEYRALVIATSWAF